MPHSKTYKPKKIKPLEKPKRINKRPLQKECMKLWAECVKERAGNKCEYPGCYKTEFLNAHHVFSRSRQSTRYDIDNGICLCSGHHSLLADSAHKDPLFILKITGQIAGIKAIRTKQWLELLTRRAYTPQKIDLEMEYIYLKKTLEELKAKQRKAV